MARRPVDKRTKQAQTLVGERIRELRKANGLSQEQLAHICDVHRTYIGHLERGEVNPTLGTLLLVGEGLRVNITDLLDTLDDLA
jgi:transcriptional regulator with XRE-family HTH domain